MARWEVERSCGGGDKQIARCRRAGNTRRAAIADLCPWQLSSTLKSLQPYYFPPFLSVAQAAYIPKYTWPGSLYVQAGWLSDIPHTADGIASVKLAWHLQLNCLTVVACRRRKHQHQHQASPARC